MGWKTDKTTGLLSGYRKKITEAYFAHDDRRGPDLQLHLSGEVVMADGSDAPVENPEEHIDMLSCGKGWQTDDGRKAEHPQLEDFRAVSQVGVFIDRLTGLCDEAVLKKLTKRGDPTGADPWEGLEVEIERARIPLNRPMTVTDDDGSKRTISEYEQIVPVALLAIDGTQVEKKGKPARAKAEPEEPGEDEAKDQEPDITALSEAADEGSDDAIDKLTALAEQLGLDTDDYETWPEVAEAITEASAEKAKLGKKAKPGKGR